MSEFTFKTTSPQKESLEPQHLLKMPDDLCKDDTKFVHVELRDGALPQIVDGPAFDYDYLKEQVSFILGNFQFATPSLKNDFLQKVCRAFGFPTSVATSDSFETYAEENKPIEGKCTQTSLDLSEPSQSDGDSEDPPELD